MPPFLTTYKVSTQHPSQEGEFVVPVAVEAASPFEAAEKRFALQLAHSRQNTTALLVTDGSRSSVYPVTQEVIRTVKTRVSPHALVA